MKNKPHATGAIVRIPALTILATLCMAPFGVSAASAQTAPAMQQHNAAIQQYNTTSSVCRYGLDDCYFANGRAALILSINELTQFPHLQAYPKPPGKPSGPSDALTLLRKALSRLKPSGFTTGTNFSESEQEKKDREDAAWLSRPPWVMQNLQLITTGYSRASNFVPRLEALVLPSGDHQTRALAALRYAEEEFFAICGPAFRPFLMMPGTSILQESDFYQELGLAENEMSNALKRSKFAKVALPKYEK